MREARQNVDLTIKAIFSRDRIHVFPNALQIIDSERLKRRPSPIAGWAVFDRYLAICAVGRVPEAPTVNCACELALLRLRTHPMGHVDSGGLRQPEKG